MNSDKHRQQAEQALRKAYRDISTETPGELLDAKIIAAAHANAAAAKPVATVAKWRRWSTPLASAAVLVLGVTFIIKSNIVERWDQQSQPHLRTPAEESAATEALQHKFSSKTQQDKAVNETSTDHLQADKDSRQLTTTPQSISVESNQTGDTAKPLSLPDDMSDEMTTNSRISTKKSQLKSKTEELSKSVSGALESGAKVPTQTAAQSAAEEKRTSVANPDKPEQTASIDNETKKATLEKLEKVKKLMSQRSASKEAKDIPVNRGAVLEEVMVTAQTAPKLPAAGSRIAALDGIAGTNARSNQREKKMLIITESEALQKLLRARYNEWYFLEQDDQWLTLRRQFNQRRYKISKQLLAKELPHWHQGQAILSSDIPLATNSDVQPGK